MLDDLDILPTITWFCRKFRKTYPAIRIETQIEIEEGEIHPLLKTTIYRLMQEALNNAAKHSKADLVGFTLRKAADKIEFIIKDNGQGFDVGKALSVESTMRGFGLTSMRERAEISNGSFAVESAEGKGTTIRASWKAPDTVL
jgi:signal transduction histidine kinase